MKIKRKRKAGIISLFLSLALIVGIVPTRVFAISNNDVPINVLLNGVYPDSENVINWNLDATKAFLSFTDDYSSRDEYNITALTYSIYDKNTKSWGYPLIISDDGTCDMQPFLMNDIDDKLITAWTNANEVFTEHTTKEEIASAMRISVKTFDFATGNFNNTVVSNADFYNSENISTFNPKIVNIDGKILVTWVVCKNISADTNSYGIEGLYYNPTNGTFYDIDNSPTPDPMVFVKNSKYISTYSISDVNNQIVSIYAEENSDTHISDVMHDKVVTKDFLSKPPEYKNSSVKITNDFGKNITALTDGTSYSQVIHSDSTGLYYYNNNYIYKLNSDNETATKITTSSNNLLDSEYSIISKNGNPYIIATLGKKPLTVTDNEYTYYDKTYTKVNDKWVDEDGNEKDLTYDTVDLYLIKENNTATKLNYTYSENKFFRNLPSFSIDANNNLISTFVFKQSPQNFVQNMLASSIVDSNYLMSGNYSAVDKQISIANSLNASVYKDFSSVTNAINAVVRDKDITEQEAVNAMAKTIEDAIKALEYKGANYTKVDEAITKANALNKDNFKDFSAVETAIKAVVRDKNITEQEAVNAMAKAIEDAIKALELKPVTPPFTVPEIIEGTNQSIEQGKNATFKSNADLKDFKKVLVDGKEVSSDNYTLKEGSTIVTLKSDYIKTLSVGKHTINIVFTTGSADTEFFITKTTNPDTNNPQTGDSSNMIIWIFFLIFSTGAILTFILKYMKPTKVE